MSYAEAQREFYGTEREVVARAKDLQNLGYIVLVARAECGHWTGYSAFKRNATSDAESIWVYCSVLLTGDPMVIFQKPN